MFHKCPLYEKEKRIQAKSGKTAFPGKVKVLAILTVAVMCSGFVYAQTSSMTDEGVYRVFAEFDSVSGLKSGDAVEIAGVSVGSVVSVGLGPRDRARVQINLRDDLALPIDSEASIQARGMAGKKVLGIKRGSSAKALRPGEDFLETRSLALFEEMP